MNWLLAGVASIGVVVCLTAFVLFATSSVWAFLILVTIIGICIYGPGVGLGRFVVPRRRRLPRNRRAERAVSHLTFSEILTSLHRIFGR